MMAASFSTSAVTSSAQMRDFRRRTSEAIADIANIWPNAGIEASTEGVTVTKTTTSIRPRAKNVTENPLELHNV
mgnify:FL=1